jgi:hypothetical protein
MEAVVANGNDPLTADFARTGFLIDIKASGVAVEDILDQS